jgi:UDP-sugar transporter A1/2/3
MNIPVNIIPAGLLVLQTGLQPFLQRYANKSTKFQRVLTGEYLKLLLAFFLTKVERLPVNISLISQSLVSAVLPGSVYALQNLLVQQAYDDLDELTFNLLNQTKLGFTAIWLRVLEKEEFDSQKLLSLFLMSISSSYVAISKTSQKKNSEATKLTEATETSIMKNEKSQYETLRGSLCAFAAASCSGLANCLCQRAMSHENQSASLFTLCLSSFSISIFTAGHFILRFITPKNVKQVSKGWSITENFATDSGSLTAVFSQAVGGVLVGRVTKKLGAIMKCMCAIMSIIVTAVVQPLLYGGKITLAEKIGMVGISISMILQKR